MQRCLIIAWASTLLLGLPPCSYSFHLPLCHRQPNFSLHRRCSLPSIIFSDGRHLHSTPLCAVSDADDDDGDLLDENYDSDDFPAAAQDLRLFVTQRCVQAFMFLLSSTRDLHTVWWLDDFVQPITINNYWDEDDEYKPGAGDTFRESDKRLGSKLLNYHGLSALNTTLFPEWDSFFTSLLQKSDTVLKIKTPQNVGQRAYSEFDIDIEPARLCARILSVREQIAREMIWDLEAIANMGQSIFNSYWENSKERKDTKQKSKGSNEAGDDEESSPKAFDHPSTFYSTFDPHDDDEVAPSPLRKSNFDLLYNLITQSAIIHLLKSEDGIVVGEDPIENKASQMYLSNFYEDRLVTHFVGSQWYGKGDDFIEELMLGSPIMMSRDGGNPVDDEEGNEESKASSRPPLEIEPMRIAEQVLLKRDKLALEWLAIMEAVPSDHTDIRKLQLERLTGVAETAPVKLIVEDEFQ